MEGHSLNTLLLELLGSLDTFPGGADLHGLVSRTHAIPHDIRTGRPAVIAHLDQDTVLVNALLLVQVDDLASLVEGGL